MWCDATIMSRSCHDHVTTDRQEGESGATQAADSASQRSLAHKLAEAVMVAEEALEVGRDVTVVSCRAVPCHGMRWRVRVWRWGATRVLSTRE